MSDASRHDMPQAQYNVCMTKWLIILFCALVSEWQFITQALPNCECNARFAQIVAGTDISPFVYRVLTPAIIVALGNSLMALAVFHLVMLIVFFALLWAWVDQWNHQGLAATALATLALSAMYPTWYISEYTITEWVLLLLALQCLSYWRHLTVK